VGDRRSGVRGQQMGSRHAAALGCHPVWAAPRRAVSGRRVADWQAGRKLEVAGTWDERSRFSRVAGKVLRDAGGFGNGDDECGESMSWAGSSMGRVLFLVSPEAGFGNDRDFPRGGSGRSSDESLRIGLLSPRFACLVPRGGPSRIHHTSRFTLSAAAWRTVESHGFMRKCEERGLRSFIARSTSCMRWRRRGWHCISCVPWEPWEALGK
jgi:hypothetical protein